MAQYTIIDDTHPDLVYTGNWTILYDPVDPRSPHYNRSIHVTKDPTATVSYQFHGTNLNVFGTIDTPATKGYPNASFVIEPNAVAQIHLNQNGDLPKSIDPRSATTHLRLFSSGKFAMGAYNMIITADGVSPNGPSFYFDFLTVLIPDGTPMDLEHVIVDDDDKIQWKYGPSWRDGDQLGNYLYTSHRVYNMGISVELPFQGTDIVVYGVISNNYNQSKSIGEFQVDNSPARTIKLSDVPNAVQLDIGATPLHNQPIFSTSGLTPGYHTLTINVPTDSGSITRSDATWAVDYAIFGPVLGTPTSQSLPPGVIAGGVVGSLVFLGVILIAFLLWKRRRRQYFEETEVGEEFLLKGSSTTPFSSEPDSSKAGLPGRMPSMHKPAQRQHRDPVSPISSGLGVSTLDSTSELSSPRSEEPATTRYRIPRREMDGGVRLAPSSLDGEEVEEVLPPSYAQYG